MKEFYEKELRRAKLSHEFVMLGVARELDNLSDKLSMGKITGKDLTNALEDLAAVVKNSLYFVENCERNYVESCADNGGEKQ